MTRDASSRIRMWLRYSKEANEVQLIQCIYRMKNALSIAQFLAAKASTEPLLCTALISHIVRGTLDPTGIAG